MTPPNDYDVENDLRRVAQARADADELTRAVASIGDAIADGFRARFDITMDMEHSGLTLMIGAAMLCPIAKRGDMSASVLTDALAMAAENLVRTARSRAAEAREVEGVLCEHVLTWHPVDEPDDALGVEIPLYQHIELPSGLGELRSHTREVVPAPADKLPVWEDESDRAYCEMVELGRPSPEVSGG